MENWCIESYMGKTCAFLKTKTTFFFSFIFGAKWICLETKFQDYYAILGISPDASGKEIKNAYRILVMKYHPDKNPGEVTNAHFLQISAAYEILQNPIKRKKYHDRYFYDYIVSKEKEINAESILKNCRSFLENLQYTDPVRMNSNALNATVAKVLSETDILYLLKEKKDVVNREIAEILLQCCFYLNFPGVAIICDKLKILSKTDEVIQMQAQKIFRYKKFSWFWKRNEWWIILTVVLIFCALIFFMH